MTTLERGLYEQLLTEALVVQHSAPGVKVVLLRRKLHQTEAEDRLVRHLSRVIERVLQHHARLDLRPQAGHLTLQPSWD